MTNCSKGTSFPKQLKSARSVLLTISKYTRRARRPNRAEREIKMKIKKRNYYLVHADGDTFLIKNNGIAEQIKNGVPTGKIEPTRLLRDSGYKYKWVNK